VETPVDADWLNGIRQGDRNTLGKMLENCRPDLKKRIEQQLGRTSVGGHISVSDIVQDTCERVLERHDQFQGQSTGEWLLWVRTIASNFLLMELRRKSLGHQSLEDIIPTNAEPVLEQLANSSKTPSEKFGVMEREALVRAAVQELIPRDQKLVYYRCELNLTWDAIGKKLGCSADAASNRFKNSVLPELEIRLGFLNEHQ